MEHKTSDVNKCITLSLGITSITSGESINIDALIERADKALYRAKENGRNQIVLASSL